MNKPILVIRGNDICFLGIIKSLSKSNIPFETITFTWNKAKKWWSEESTFFKKNIIIENPFSCPEIALNQLISHGKNIIDKWGEPLLTLPSSDTNLMFFMDNEEELNPYYRLIGDKKFNSFRSDVANKYSCFKILSEGCSNLCPKTVECKNINDISTAIKDLKYPTIFKPTTKDYGQSFYAKYRGMKAVESKDSIDLKTKIVDCINSNFEIIIQEKVLFDKAEDEIPFYAYVDKNHNIRMAATGIKELIQPYPFGTANILRLSWHPELLPIAQKVVKKLKWRGIIMIEFIRDKKDSKWKVIEINIRPWLFIGFYELFGLKYLSLLYQDWQNLLDNFDGRIIFPSKEVLFNSPIHVDIGGIVNFGENIIKTGNLEKSFLKFYHLLQKYSNAITYPYYDPKDQKLARKYLKNIFISENLRNDIPYNFENYFFNPEKITKLTDKKIII